jgi:uncharacterized protein (DUF305 family)
MRRSSRLVAALVCAGGLAGCGAAADIPDTAPISAGPEHNAADVAFVVGLIPHHRAGIELAQEVAKQPDRQVLAEAIITTEQDEITRMTGWLATWGVTAVPPSTAPASTVPASTVPASASAPAGDPVKALAAHQEEAIPLAQKEQAQGSNAAALAFAKQVIESRTAEASELRASAQ